MFDPIKASKEIKDSYIDYITTTFDMADTDYAREFRKELQADGMVASGPFLDIGGSYETGHTLRELIQAQKASVLFESLEPVAEKERELKLDRPLYQHQEAAMLKAGKGENLVVTTGTGSGKTESFFAAHYRSSVARAGSRNSFRRCPCNHHLSDECVGQ